MNRYPPDTILLATVPDPEVSIILPTFNEAKNVRELFEQIAVVMDWSGLSYECIFVDDSADKTTAAIFYAAGSYQQRVTLIKRSGEDAKTGLTQAFRRGFAAARGDILVCMDTDLQHPPAVIPQLVEAVRSPRVDVAVASRYTEGGSAEGLDGWFRHLVSQVTNTFVHICLPGTRATTDPMTGFFAFKRSQLEHVTFSSFGFKILVELLSSLKEPRVVDIPFTFQKRVGETSKATMKQGIIAYRDIVRLFFSGDRGSTFVRTLLVAYGVMLLVLVSFPMVSTGEYTGVLDVSGSVLPLEHSSAFFLTSLIVLVGAILVMRWCLRRDLYHTYSPELFFLAVIFSITVLLTYWYLVSGLNITDRSTSVLLLGMSFVLIILLGRSLWSKDYRNFFAPERWTIPLILTLALSVIAYFMAALQWWEAVLLGLYLLVISQGMFALYLMIYTWERGDHDQEKPKQSLAKPYYSFSAIVPCKHEKGTIADTLRAMHRINYPEDKKEILVVIHKDSDDGTIGVVEKTIAELQTDRIRLVTYNAEPVNKPHGLNEALAEARGDYVAVFDAEDETHPDIFTFVNDELLKSDADVVQSGVQLMNHESSWFATFNVLEYYFWFKSSLHFYARRGVVPLGGVGVFFRRTLLERVGGWDMTCLTEDAEIGLRLSRAGAHFSVIYDPTYSTREETPATVTSFIKQRTRWAQGFLQILSRGGYWYLPKFEQKLLALYILTWPLLLPILFLLLPLGVSLIFFVSLAPMVAVIANISLLLFFMFIVVQVLGLYEFCRDYGRRFSLRRLFLVVALFYPYTVLLVIASIRAFYRHLTRQRSWEKTEHTNAHRSQDVQTFAPGLSPVVVQEQDKRL